MKIVGPAGLAAAFVLATFFGSAGCNSRRLPEHGAGAGPDGAAAASGAGGGLSGAGGAGGAGAGGAGAAGGASDRGGASGGGAGGPGTGGASGGGTAGAGGASGTGLGGAGGYSCSALSTAYLEALASAKMCSISSGHLPCQIAVQSIPGCACKTYVDDATTVSAIAALWTAAGCTVPCPQIACSNPQPGNCATTGTAATATCRDTPATP